MANFPVHPALAAMMLRMRTVDRAGGALLAALCAEGERLPALRRMADFRRIVEAVLRDRPREIWRLAERWAGGALIPRLPVDDLAPYLLWAFPGHLARRRDRTSGRYLLAAGFGAILPPDSPLINAEWLLIVNMSDADAEAVIRWAVPLTPAHLALCRRTTATRIAWDKASARLIAAEEERIGALLLKSRPLKEIPPEARLEAEKCRLRHQGLPWEPAAEAFAARVAFLRRALPEEAWPAFEPEQLIERLAACPEMPLLRLLQALLAESGHTVREVDAEAPTHYQVPTGQRFRIDYTGEQPFVAFKLQLAFGIRATPRLARGRVPLLFRLLSPAQRPVQITADLASFWANGYAIVRKDLRGRYPKHAWPENPLEAPPPAPRRAGQ